MRLATALAVMGLTATGATPLRAQSQAERRDGLAIAEAAATQAERAAEEAERAAVAARQAATAARAAVTAARVAMGVQAPSPAPRATGDAGPARMAAADLPEDENVEVHPKDGSAAEDRQHRTFVDGLAAGVVNGANDGDLKSARAPDFQLLATSKDKTASLAWTLDVSGQPRSGFLAADLITLKASTKLDDNGDAEFLNLDGFTRGTEVELSFVHYGTKVRLTGDELNEVATARVNCERLGKNAKECDPYGYATGVSAFVAKYNGAEYDQMMGTVLPGAIWFYGGTLSASQANYKFLDRTAFKIGKVDRLGVGASLFGGVLLDQANTSLTGSFAFRRSYDEGDAVMLCQPVAGTSQTQCITGADGRPTRMTQKVAGFEVRHAFPVPLGSFASLALAPKATYDLDSHAYGVDVPIYFADDGSGKLRGGIRATYVNQRDKDKGGRTSDFALGVFVGVPFTVFQQ